MTARQNPTPISAHAYQRNDLVTEVADAISAMIVDGRLQPGERLGEERIAAELGVSRAPLREAARLLVATGLLVQVPRRGFFVRSLTPEALDQIYDLRIALESHVVGEMALARPDTLIDDLARQMEQMRAAADAGDDRSMVETDFGFHRLICLHAGNPRIVRAFDAIASETRMVIGLIGALYDDAEQIAETHVPIVDAIADRDAERARTCLDWHIRVAWREVRRLFVERQGDDKEGDSVLGPRAERNTDPHL